MQLPGFNEFRDNFYQLNVKIVPDNIYELLTPSPMKGDPSGGPVREGG